MSVVIDLEVRVDDVGEARRRLGNTGIVRKEMAHTLDEAARIGEVSADMYAPERTRRLRRAISKIPAHTTMTDALEAAVGVTGVRALAGNRAGPLTEGEEEYPLYVHEGTGLYGHFHRKITPRRRRAMRFFGQTGLVYAKATRGQRPQPFIREAFDDVLAFLPAAVDKMVRRIIGDKL